jgi:ABC-type polysaccharide/polyol phosphate transport system ATPase subunit
MTPDLVAPGPEAPQSNIPGARSGIMSSARVLPPGAIVVDHAARSFRVYPRENRALKDMIVARGRVRGADVVALRDVSFAVEPGSAVGLVGRNGSGKTTLLRLLSGIIKPSSGTVAVGGRVGSLLELGAGFHPDLTGRENVYLNGSIHGLGRVAVREKFDEIVAFAGLEDSIDLPVRTYSSGMYMRLGFAIAAHIEADVLLLDEVFAVGDEAFQRKCFGKIFDFKKRGGTIVFVSHDATAVERLCDRAVLLKDGVVEFDGPTHEAIVEYRRLLAGEREPEERSAGLKEWGGDIARVEHVRLLGADGTERVQLLAGEPFAIAADVVAERAIAPPRLVWELRDDAAILVAAGAVSTAEHGWSDATRTFALRFDADRPPFADGRLHLRVDLTDDDGQTQYHSLDDARVFVVYPSDEIRGLVRLEGRWSREDSGIAAELERA